MHDIQPFPTDDKKKLYNYINARLLGIVCEERDWLANISNAASLLYLLMNDINWSGFYLYKNDELVLGPFNGKPACTHIAIGKGVCGLAAIKREIVVVKDVREFPGHIACDGASMSEIVIPIIKNGKLYGVLDIDSPVLERFGEEDSVGLERFVGILNEYVDWDKAVAI